MRLNSLPLLALVGLALLAAPASAADGEMATVHRNATGLVFDSLVQHGGATLTVTGPDGYAVRKTFAAGENPIFSIFDQAGATLADGAYTFEVLFNPKLDGAARQALVRARAKGETPQIKSFEPVFGSFQIADGVLVGDAREEGGRLTSAAQPAAAGSGSLENVSAADFVINDDLIVTGSACVGFDCINGEVFGFDTIRLKENNLRIKFLDTSVGSFPSGDWQLTANDSASGGANKFSIDDIDNGRTPFTITASAPSHSIFVSSAGRVGLGTNVPVVNLHVVSGNTPTLRLDQNGTSGFTPQVWDVAGNETNFFVRDATNGSRLPFRIQPNAPSNSIFVAGTSGNIGVGTSSPATPIHIVRSTGADATLYKMENNGGVRFEFVNSIAGTGGTWQFINTTSPGGADLVIRETVANATEEFRLTESGNLTISGQLVTGGPQCPLATPCDEVFNPSFSLESIEEHANKMFSDSHLPAVGPTISGKPFNVTEKMAGILNELEKAHIYIAQLAKEKQQLEQRLQRLEELVLSDSKDLK